MAGDRPVVFLVDDEESVLSSLSRSLESYGYDVRTYSLAEEFLKNYNNEYGCLVLDLHLNVMNGFALQEELKRRRLHIPIIFMSGWGGVTESVEALRKGAIDFLEKPFRTERLVKSIEEAIQQDEKNKIRMSKENDVLRRINKLTGRERDIFNLLVRSDEPPSSKVIARKLNISHRTVENHKSRIFDKLEVHTMVELRLTVGKVLSLTS